MRFAETGDRQERGRETPDWCEAGVCSVCVVVQVSSGGVCVVRGREEGGG